MTGDRIFVYGVARTPFGKFQGQLSGYSAAALGAAAINEVLARSSLPASAIDSVLIGQGMIGGAALTVGRQAVLYSDLPETTPSLGLDRACCSGMSSVAVAMAELRNGTMANALICGGLESLSTTPRLLPRKIPLTGDAGFEDPLLLNSPFSDGSIARYTSEEALKFGVDRAAQDEWALKSHARYFAAEDRGFFAFERFALQAMPASDRLDPSMVIADESPRRDSDLEKLSRLSPVRGSTTITAGNAPGLSDGAAFMLIGGSSVAARFGATPLAEIVATVRVAEGPTSGTRTPAIAIQKLLAACHLRIEQIDAIEINEAFAATPLVSTLVLAGSDVRLAEKLRRITNQNGGSVAIGHPMGASGARIISTLINQLRSRGGGLGVAAICGGFGQGEAVLIKMDGG